MEMSHHTPMGARRMSPGGEMSMPEMHTSFFWGKDVIILFFGWPNRSLPMYILACLFVFFMAAIAELLSLKFRPAASRPVMGAVVQSSFYAVRMAIAYMVMLAVMSFNLGIFIAAVLGHSLGHFVVKIRRDLRQQRPANGDVKI